MALLDELEGFERRVVDRLNELRPLMEEYEQLQRLADRFGIDPNAATSRPAAPKRRTRTAKRGRTATSTPRRARTRASSSRSQPGGTRAIGVERRTRVLELIEQRPGITVPEISKELGVEAPPLYRVVRKLQAEGVVKKEDKSLRLA